MVDQLGTPDSPAPHVLERYRLLDHDAEKAIEDHNHKDNLSPPAVDNGIAPRPNYKGKGLDLEFTVEDDGVFTSPWSASMIYWPPLMQTGQWPEITCAETATIGTTQQREPRCRWRISSTFEVRIPCAKSAVPRASFAVSVACRRRLLLAPSTNTRGRCRDQLALADSLSRRRRMGQGKEARSWAVHRIGQEQKAF
jgi:hypothetical protein